MSDTLSKFFKYLRFFFFKYHINKIIKTEGKINQAFSKMTTNLLLHTGSSLSNFFLLHTGIKISKHFFHGRMKRRSVEQYEAMKVVVLVYRLEFKTASTPGQK